MQRVKRNNPRIDEGRSRHKRNRLGHAHSWRERRPHTPRVERGGFELILSPAILEEIGRALSYEKIKKHRWVTDEEVLLLIEGLAEKSTLVPGHANVSLSRDPDDDKFLAAAFEGKADYLVTGDRDLLALQSFKGTQIVRPAAFLKLLAKEERK